MSERAQRPGCFLTACLSCGPIAGIDRGTRVIAYIGYAANIASAGGRLWYGSNLFRGHCCGLLGHA